MRLASIRTPAPLAVALRHAVSPNSVELHWLGQAGFVLRTASTTVLIDPYLSDSLAVKYENHRYPHRRLMPAPIDVGSLPVVDLVLCTHGHTDHMDPWTLRVLTAVQPDVEVLVPAAHVELAWERGVPASSLVEIDSDEERLIAGSPVRAVASAHEELETDSRGRSLHLGYILTLEGVSIYHSGDCAPYEGLGSTIEKLSPDIALLPVNGRDSTRLDNGVPGNFTFEEAADLCAEAGISAMVAHHFGMFDFNTVDTRVLRRAVRAENRIQTIQAELGARYVLTGEAN